MKSKELAELLKDDKYKIYYDSIIKKYRLYMIVKDHRQITALKRLNSINKKTIEMFLPYMKKIETFGNITVYGKLDKSYQLPKQKRQRKDKWENFKKPRLLKK